MISLKKLTAETPSTQRRRREFQIGTRPNLPRLVRPQQVRHLKRQAYVRLNFLWLKLITGAKQKQLIASSVGAGAGITLIKRKHTVIKGLANRRLVLATQKVLSRKLGPLSKIDVLITKGGQDLRHQAFRTQRKIWQDQI